ncbi:MAG: hypothetical protein V1755_07305, partial [Chloroflexota bacterium]
MKTFGIFLAAGSILSLVLAGCTMPSTAGPGPRTWIDEPLDGSTLPLGPIVVRSHAASDGGTKSATLLVNGAQVRTDGAADPSNPLVEIPQVWQPEAPGDYTLQVVTLDQQGNEGSSKTIRVRVGAQVANPAPIQGGQPPEAPATAETRIPASLLHPATATWTPATACQVPTFTFSINANCREGPSTDYEVDTSFLTGQTAQIDGRNATDPRWWWVSMPGGGHCWVSGSTGTTSCLIADVPVIAAPPLPVVVIPTDTSAPPPPPPPPPPPSKPTAPGGFSVTNKVCDSSSYVVGLTWGDSSGEDGYRV